jgi:hypothetical protein
VTISGLGEGGIDGGEVVPADLQHSRAEHVSPVGVGV